MGFLGRGVNSLPAFSFMKRLLLAFVLLISYASVTNASWNLRMKYVGTTNTPNLDVRWHGSVNYFGYQDWNAPGGADIYTPNETREVLGITDSVLPVDGNTFVVQWAIAGSGAWNIGSASVAVPRGGDSGVMEWSLGGAPPPVGAYAYTNSSAVPVTFEYKDSNGAQTVTIQPGESLTVSSTNAFTVSQVSSYVDGVGEFAQLKYKTNLLASYAGGSPFTGVVPSPPTYNSRTSTNTPVFVDPATDEQRSANAIVNATRDAKDQNASDNAALLGELKKIGDKVSTNRNPASVSEKNEGIGAIWEAAQAASNVVANAVNSARDDLGTKVDAFTAPTPVSLVGISVPMGAFTVNVNPFANSGFAAAASIIKSMVTWFIKAWLLWALWNGFKGCMEMISKAAAGTSTSGWLQAAVLSTPQLVSTLGGLALKYVALAVVVAVVYASSSAWVAFGGTDFNLSSVVGGMSTSGQVGWAWFTNIMPVTEALTAFKSYLIGTLTMLGITMAGCAVADALGKA